MGNDVTIKRGGVTKSISKDQWKAMKKQTYGWSLHHEISDEVLEVEKEIQKESKPKQKRNGKKNADK